MQALLALVLSLSAHNRSEGRSDFILDDTGVLSIRIQIGDLDLPELCNADLSLRDRAAEEQKLTSCLERDFSRWLRVHGDGRRCPVTFQRWHEEKGTVTLDGTAACPQMPKQLVIDWGLFAGSPLDHVSVATVRQPHAKPRLAMVSKRASKITVDVAGPAWPYFVAAGAAALSLMTGAIVIVRRRRRGRG